ncbi:Conserved hypothetical protein [gamma proteobacterium HdN1]|nr:Conserved hypothetical protein [gamma proteobacterium HdN1]
MNLLIFQGQDAQFHAADHNSGDLIVTGRQLRHLQEIHGASLGTQVRVGLLNGNQGIATIQEWEADHAKLTFTLTSPPPPSLPATLLLALPRPKMLKRILQTVAAMGVKSVYLINTYRVEKSYWQSPFLLPEAIFQELLLGLEQGVDTQLPQVQLRTRFKPFVEDELPALLQGKLGLVAHPTGEAHDIRALGEQASVLAIGPEGGFIPYEIEKLQAAGFRSLSLGPRILRVETAIPVLLTRLYG